jgi:hypothetical protein
MNWTFEKRFDPEYIRIVGSGLFSGEGFTKMFDELFALEYWRLKMPLFFDHRLLDFSTTTSMDLLNASDDFISRNEFLAFTRIAVIFDDSMLDLAVRFNAITKPSSQAKVHLYRSEKAAVDWLTSKDAMNYKN